MHWHWLMGTYVCNHISGVVMYEIWDLAQQAAVAFPFLLTLLLS